MTLYLFCGSRDWGNTELIEKELEKLPKLSVVIQGGASGADSIAKYIAKRQGKTVKTENADWDRYGKAAGPIRNRIMLSKGVSMVFAFHNDLKKSKGTLDCVTEALYRGIPVRLIREES